MFIKFKMHVYGLHVVGKDLYAMFVSTWACISLEALVLKDDQGGPSVSASYHLMYKSIPDGENTNLVRHIKIHYVT